MTLSRATQQVNDHFLFHRSADAYTWLIIILSLLIYLLLDWVLGLIISCILNKVHSLTCPAWGSFTWTTTVSPASPVACPAWNTYRYIFLSHNKVWSAVNNIRQEATHFFPQVKTHLCELVMWNEALSSLSHDTHQTTSSSLNPACTMYNSCTCSLYIYTWL